MSDIDKGAQINKTKKRCEMETTTVNFSFTVGGVTDSVNFQLNSLKNFQLAIDYFKNKQVKTLFVSENDFKLCSLLNSEFEIRILKETNLMNRLNNQLKKINKVYSGNSAIMEVLNMIKNNEAINAQMFQQLAKAVKTLNLVLGFFEVKITVGINKKRFEKIGNCSLLSEGLEETTI